MTLYESRRLFTLAQPIAAMEISTNLSDGSHVVAVPERLRGLGELLLLAPSTAQGRTQNHYREMHATRWILDTGTGALEVVPQDWFNEGSYDVGYQLITRAARLLDTGEIVGEGIRLGVFVLDSSHRQIAEWLVTDIFYHPERDRSASLSS